MWINLPQIKHFINKDSNETSRIKTSAVFTRSAFITTNRLDEDIDLKIIIIIVRIYIVKSIDDGNEVILHMCLLHRYLDIHFTQFHDHTKNVPPLNKLTCSAMNFQPLSSRIHSYVSPSIGLNGLVAALVFVEAYALTAKAATYIILSYGLVDSDAWSNNSLYSSSSQSNYKP